jgi:ribosomal protection tetracycline resistance protein
MNFLNIGILAHVDAGKTSLTERLIFNAGVIDYAGSVDDGNTQTDSLALERQRGITIKTAAVSFVNGNTTINLLDTPGHPDFIAEVERILNVLDGAVLVISAVEGVQAQTRILMRALLRLKIPTVIFVNKIDRPGARYNGLLDDIVQKLTPGITPMGIVSNIGKPNADFVAYEVSNESVAGTCPVFAGSAITGAGTITLASQLTRLLPTAKGNANDQLSGAVFKIDRGEAGEKIAYVRLFSGTLHIRDTLHFGSGSESKVTAISVFNNGTTMRKTSIVAGEIGKLWGLSDIQVGDAIGVRTAITKRYFAPPTLETAITPRNAADKIALHAALAQLAEQDPLINLRQDDIRQELYVSLYGEVQKEVIQATLLSDFCIDIHFERTTTICIERPNGVGQAVQAGTKLGDPFLATVGLRVEPGPTNSGVQFRLSKAVLGTMPPAFFKVVEDSVYDTMRQGLRGWQVMDCLVTMTHSGYWPRQSHSHARFDKSMSSTGADFRGLTPLVVMDALKQAGTTVYGPLHQFELEIPADTLNEMLPILSKYGAIPLTTQVQGAVCFLSGTIPADQIHGLQQRLPALTRGEAVLECTFERYEAIRGEAPTRPRTDSNPLNRQEYMLKITR